MQLYRRLTPGATGLLLLLLGCGACGDDLPGPTDGGGPGPLERPTLDATYRPSGHAAAGDVFVHLFEWRWPDVARECETVLGPAGYRAVQISPPQEHLVLAGQGYPWWQRYQPASHSLDRSRSGTRAELVDMVTRCAAAGVDVYVDAVINHMSAGAGTGSAGTVYTKYEYPGLFGLADFHPPCTVDDYQREANVQDCELVGLADLNTGLPEVRRKLADYLLSLVRVGVAGFRIDAAKHMQPVELDAILDRVNEDAAAEGLPRPYWFAEVIDHGGEAVEAGDYFGLAHGTGGAADITEFRFRGVGEKFLGAGGQTLAQLDPDGPPGSGFSPGAWGLIPADKAVVFLENHDTQRGSGVWHRDGDAYRLAHVFMLAHPYGYPKVMSSYAFDRASQPGRDRGPPSGGDGATLPVDCAASLEAAQVGDWVCEHRDPVIAAMVGFRRAVAGGALERWWSNGSNAVAFSRGSLGFVALNGEDEAIAVDVATGLPPGAYCDVLTGPAPACAGVIVEVAADGTAHLELEAGRALALHVGSRPGAAPHAPLLGGLTPRWPTRQ
jgi:alpha-amylase